MKLRLKHSTHFAQFGVHSAIDDFGSGYSSFAYLRDFAIDTLKIDRSLVAEIDKNEHDLVIVSSIISLAHGLGIDVVAEGVETTPQLRKLAFSELRPRPGFHVCSPDAHGSSQTIHHIEDARPNNWY